MSGVRLGRHFSKHTCWAWAEATEARPGEPGPAAGSHPGAPRVPSRRGWASRCQLLEEPLLSSWGGEIPGEGLLCG